MAKVLTRTARKDYPEHGIKKGDTYYKVSLKTGPRSSRTLKSKTPFKRAQLTTSDFLSRAYTIADETIRDIKSAEDWENLKTEVEELQGEQQEKLDNMPEGLQQGSTGQTLQERIDECQEFHNELDSMEFHTEEEWDELEADSRDHDSYEDYVASKIEEIEGSCPW